MSSLPYHEPDRITIFVQSSFLLLLNVVDYLLNYAFYCGLLGQVLLGIAFGTPGGNFLSLPAQEIIVQLGYLGLILLVYEGGLSVPLTALKANIGVAIGVAVTGIAVPVGLSFVLQPLLDATPLQAFAAGAALCSTSLGTTFTLLSTSGLADSRIGSVLSTAAMMDDVVGLVMVQVISNLGSTSGTLDPVIVIRPIMVSLAFAILVPLLCRYAVRPFRHAARRTGFAQRVGAVLANRRAKFLLHSVFLFGLVAAASYSGTSALFTAYLAGATVNWWDNEPKAGPENDQPAPQPSKDESAGAKVAAYLPENGETAEGAAASSNSPEEEQQSPEADGLSGAGIYRLYFLQPVERLLRPFFFASIGFSIPIADLFKGPVLWRGIVYTILMIISKLACGAWLVRMPPILNIKNMLKRIRYREACGTRQNQPQTPEAKTTSSPTSEDKKKSKEGTDGPLSAQTATPEPQPEPPALPNDTPVSLYPAAMLGCAMVARGEIGFLISSVAESHGIWRTDQGAEDGRDAAMSTDMFLVVTWAIFLCTFFGPITVGLLVRRVKRLERATGPGRRDALGSWGVSGTS